MFAVSVFPLYERDTGDLCAYSEDELLGAAMQRAGETAESWLAAPREGEEGEDKSLAGFDITVEIKQP